MNCQLKKQHCIACGLCQVLAPHFFDYDEEGIVLFKHEPPTKTSITIPSTQQKEVYDAIQHCPVRALLVQHNPISN